MQSRRAHIGGRADWTRVERDLMESDLARDGMHRDALIPYEKREISAAYARRPSEDRGRLEDKCLLFFMIKS